MDSNQNSPGRITPGKPGPQRTHTPGPWKVSERLYCEIVTDDGTAHGRLIADTQNAYRDGAECVANARLIAAAPEMLAALEKALADLAAVAEECTKGNGIKPGRRMTYTGSLPAIRAAIAKATTK